LGRRGSCEYGDAISRYIKGVGEGGGERGISSPTNRQPSSENRTCLAQLRICNVQQGWGLSERSWRRIQSSGMWCCIARCFGGLYRHRPQVLTQGCTNKFCSMAPDTCRSSVWKVLQCLFTAVWNFEIFGAIVQPLVEQLLYFWAVYQSTRHNIPWDSNLRAQTQTYTLQVTFSIFINVNVMISQLRLGIQKKAGM